MYKEEIKSVSDQIKKLNDELSKAKSNTNQASSGEAKETIKKCQKEIEKLNRSQRELQRELEFQAQQYKDTYAFLKKKIPDLFKNQEESEAKKNNMQELSTVLI